MTRLFLCFFIPFLFFFAACTEPPQPCTGDSCPTPCKTVADARTSSAVFTIEKTTAPFQNCYARGTTHTVAFSLIPKSTANLQNEQAIIVVDVRPNAKDGDSLLGSMFDRNSFKVNPDIFSKPIPMSQLRTGIKANVTFTLLNNAPTGDLVFIVSAFRGTQATQDGDLIGRAFHYFKVE